MTEVSSTLLQPLPVCEVHEGDSPLVLSMPHSGTALPPQLAGDYRPEALALVDTDWHIPRLYDFAGELGATVIKANYSRYVIDLNRPPDGASLYPGQATTGLCPTTFFDGRPLYREGCEPGDEAIAGRVETFWRPYHEAIAAQLRRVVAAHGRAVLYDCHSIASEVPRLFEGTLPVLNLGTARGASCRPELEAALTTQLAASDHSHIVNGRFVGGYITRQYGRAGRTDSAVDAVQMEIGQDGYMHRRPGYEYAPEKADALRTTLRELLETCRDVGG